MTDVLFKFCLHFSGEPPLYSVWNCINRKDMVLFNMIVEIPSKSLQSDLLGRSEFYS